MTQQFGNHLVSFALILGPFGRIAEKVERAGCRQTRYAYEYDPKGRLVQVSRDGRPGEQYGYDAAGRRSWDWSPQRGRRTLDYDSAGRLRRAGELEFYYRQDNTLGSRYQGKRQALHLDYGGNLGLRRVTTRHGRSVDFRSNQAGQPLAKYVDGELVEAFRWLDLVRLAEYQCLDRGYRLAFHYRDGSRLPHAATFTDGEGSRPLVFGCDQVGSLKAVAEAHGQLIKIIDYDSFGNVRSEDWGWLFIPIGFAGGLRDRDTGFVRFGHRDYDPEVGRFNAQDPQGDTGGDHDLYEYCVDDPVNAVDPRGLADIPMPWRWVTSLHAEARKHADEVEYNVDQCTDADLDRIFKAIPQSEAEEFWKSYQSRPDNPATAEEHEKNKEEIKKEQDMIKSWQWRFDDKGCIKKEEQ